LFLAGGGSGGRASFPTRRSSDLVLGCGQGADDPRVAGGARVVGGAQGAAFPVGVFAVEGDGYRAAARVADVRRGQRPAVRVVLEVVDGQCSGGEAGGGTVGGAGTGAVRGGDPQVIGGVGPEVDGWGVAGGPQPGDVDDRVG